MTVNDPANILKKKMKVVKNQITATQGQLLQWYQQVINGMNNVDYVFEKKHKIEWFQQSCYPLIESAQNQLNEIYKEYCVMENGKIKLQELTEDQKTNGEKPQPVLLEGKTIGDFDKKTNEIWNKIVAISI